MIPMENMHETFVVLFAPSTSNASKVWNISTALGFLVARTIDHLQQLTMPNPIPNSWSVFTKFEQPLTKAGLNCSLIQLINEWHDLIEYALEYLSASSTHYLRTWLKVFNSPLAEERFKNILLLVELAFCMPISTAKVERLFSRLKRVKDTTRTSLKQERLENLLRIGEEGPAVKEFNAMPAVQSWCEDKVRRPNQKASRTYKQGAKRLNRNTDNDSDVESLPNSESEQGSESDS